MSDVEVTSTSKANSGADGELSPSAQTGGAIPALTAALGLAVSAADATALALPQLSASLASVFGTQHAGPPLGEEWKAGGAHVEPAYAFATLPAEKPTFDELQERIDAMKGRVDALARERHAPAAAKLVSAVHARQVSRAAHIIEQGLAGNHEPNAGPVPLRFVRLGDGFGSVQEPTVLDSMSNTQLEAAGWVAAQRAAYPEGRPAPPRATTGAESTSLALSPAAQEVVRVQSTATVAALKDTLVVDPADWARTLRSYNTLHGWQTIPALLLLSNRLGERYNTRRRRDESIPLLRGVTNPLLYAWYRTTVGPDLATDAYWGEAVVSHTLYPFGAVMLAACFARISLLRDGGLLTTLGNRAGATLVARMHDSAVNTYAQGDAVVKAVKFATAYDSTSGLSAAIAAARTPQGIVAFASLATKLFGSVPGAGHAIATGATMATYPQETHEWVENWATGVAVVGDALAAVPFESSVPALAPSGARAHPTVLSDTTEYLADAAEVGVGLVAAVLDVAAVYTGRYAGRESVDRSSRWAELVEARATDEELRCLRNAPVAEVFLRGIGMGGPGCDTLSAQLTTTVALHQDGASWSQACTEASRCLERNPHVMAALRTGEIDLPLWREVKMKLAVGITTAVDAVVYKVTEAIVLSFVQSFDE